MHEPAEGRLRRGKAAHIVPLLAQPQQEAVQRRNHFHSAGQQRVLAGRLEIADGDAFFGVGLPAEAQIACEVFQKSVDAFLFRRVQKETGITFVLCGDAIIPDAPVDFGHHHPGRQCTAADGLERVDPVAVRLNERERIEKRDVLLVQPADERVVTQPAHRQIDHGIGVQGADHFFPRLPLGRERIDIAPCLRQPRDERVHVRPVPLHRKIQARNEKNLVTALVVQALLPEIGRHRFVVREILAVFPVVVHILQQGNGRIDVPVSPAQWRGAAAQIAESVAVVGRARVAEIVQHCLHLFRRQIFLDVDVLVVQRVGKNGHAPSPGLLQRGNLAFVEVKATAENDHGVGAAQRLAVRRELRCVGKLQTDPPAVVVEGHVCLLGQGGVDDQNAGGAEKDRPNQGRQEAGGCNDQTDAENPASLCLPHIPASSA